MEPALFVKIAEKQWQIELKRTTELLEQLSDEDLQRQISAGKNRGIYIMGHLIAVHDLMPEILGLGSAAHPGLVDVFIKQPDGTGVNAFTVARLRELWAEVHHRLGSLFEKVMPEEWFSRHQSMTDEDFAKDASRNRLSVLVNRTNHLAYHRGQLRLLK